MQFVQDANRVGRCEEPWFSARSSNSWCKKRPSPANNNCFERRVGNLNENGSRQPELEPPTSVPPVQDPVEGAAGVSTKTNRLDDFSIRPDVRFEDPRATLGGGDGRLLLPLNTWESANLQSQLIILFLDPKHRETTTPSIEIYYKRVNRTGRNHSFFTWHWSTVGLQYKHFA